MLPRLLTLLAFLSLPGFVHAAPGRTQTRLLYSFEKPGETGQLLSEYKKHLRDGEAHRLFKERVSEELGDLMWYVANVASKFGLALDDVAVANLEKTRGRFLSDVTVHDSFDADLPEAERLQTR